MWSIEEKINSKQSYLAKTENKKILWLHIFIFIIFLPLKFDKNNFKKKNVRRDRGCFFKIMSFEWGDEVKPLDEETVSLFSGLDLDTSDMALGITPSQVPDKSLKSNGITNDDDNNNNKEEPPIYNERERTITIHDQFVDPHGFPKNDDDVRTDLESSLKIKKGDGPKRKGKGKEEEEEEVNDDDEESCSEELMLVHDTSSMAPRMRTPKEIHTICLDRWDDVYPENSDPEKALKFEDAQLEWDASWYRDKIDSVLSEIFSVEKTEDVLIPVGLSKNFAIAMRGPFKRDTKAAEQGLYQLYAEYLKSTIRHAWDISTITVLEDYFKFAQECGAIDKEHVEQVAKVLKSQRKHIALMAEKLQEQLEKENISKEQESGMVDRLRSQYDHPIRKDKVKPREIDAIAIHELKTVTTKKKKFIVHDYEIQQPLMSLLDDIKKRAAIRSKRNRKRKARKKRNENKTTKDEKGKENEEEEEEEKATDDEYIVAPPSANESNQTTETSPLLENIKGTLLVCPFGGFKHKNPTWKTARHSQVETTGIFHVGEEGDLACSTQTGVVIHSIPLGSKTEEYNFPGNWHGAIREIFVDKRFLCCVLHEKTDKEKHPCQAIVFNRQTGEGKAIAVATHGHITSICTEPTKKSFWVGFANGTMFCIQWEDSLIDSSLHSRLILSIISPITKMRRIGRQLHCQIVCGLNTIDVAPMKGESITSMLNRAGDPIFTRYSMMSAFGRRGTIRVILMRNHNFAITQTAASGLIRILVPPERLTTPGIQEVVSKSEDGKGQIIEEKEVMIPNVTPFPLNQHIRVDKDKIVILYSDGTVRVIHTTRKSNKERLDEAVMDLKGVKEKEK